MRRGGVWRHSQVDVCPVHGSVQGRQLRVGPRGGLPWVFLGQLQRCLPSGLCVPCRQHEPHRGPVWHGEVQLDRRQRLCGLRGGAVRGCGCQPGLHMQRLVPGGVRASVVPKCILFLFGFVCSHERVWLELFCVSGGPLCTWLVCAICSYACPAASTTDNVNLCPAGKYSLAGAGVCTDCPASVYGSTSGLTTAACTAPCPPGYSCAVGTSAPVACPASQYSTGGTSACSPCPAGTFGSSLAQTSALCGGLCPAGRYGDTSGVTDPTCVGACFAGWACPPGSTTGQPAATKCLKGTYSTTGLGSCLPCPVGTYSASDFAIGCLKCDAGRYGTLSSTDSQCSGPCHPGFFCPAGSTTPTEPLNACPPGQWSAAGAGSCSPCAVGFYGSSVSAPYSTSSCEASCSAGFECPSGSSAPSPCPMGKYGLGGVAACQQCPAGTFGGSTGLPTAACSGPCANGRYGLGLGDTTSQCSGPCLAGYACPAGTTSQVANPCPAGKYR